MRCLTVIFGGVGVILLLIAGFFYLKENNFLRAAELTTGNVVQVERHLSVDSGYVYCPVFEFTARDGKTVDYTSTVCSDPPSYKVGDQKELYYDAADPSQVQMKDFWSEYTAVFVNAWSAAVSAGLRLARVSSVSPLRTIFAAPSSKGASAEGDRRPLARSPQCRSEKMRMRSSGTGGRARRPVSCRRAGRASCRRDRISDNPEAGQTGCPATWLFRRRRLRGETSRLSCRWKRPVWENRLFR